MEVHWVSRVPCTPAFAIESTSRLVREDHSAGREPETEVRERILKQGKFLKTDFSKARWRETDSCCKLVNSCHSVGTDPDSWFQEKSLIQREKTVSAQRNTTTKKKKRGLTARSAESAHSERREQFRPIPDQTVT